MSTTSYCPHSRPQSKVSAGTTASHGCCVGGTISGAHPNMNIESYIKTGDEINVMFRSH